MEPSPEAEERAAAGSRGFEHLQRAVAQLDGPEPAAAAQHPAATTLEQVGDLSLSSCLAVRRKARISTSPAAPRAGGLGNNSPGPDLGSRPISLK